MIAIKKHGFEKISSKNHNRYERIHKKNVSSVWIIVHKIYILCTVIHLSVII